MTAVPAEHADAWRSFSDAFTEHGKLPWKARAVDQLSELAFTHVDTHQFLAGSGDTRPTFLPGDFKESRYNLEQAMHFLGSLAVEPGEGRRLHHVVIAGLATRWTELEREHGLYPPPVRAPSEGATRADRDAIGVRQRELLHTPEGGLIAGMLRMGMDHMINAVAGQLSKGDATGERMELALREAEQRFQAALFSFDHDGGASFTSFIYNGMIRFVPAQIRQAQMRKRVTASSIDDLCPGSGGESVPRGDMLSDDAAPDPAKVVERAEDGAWAVGLLDRLTPRQRHVLERHYGLNGTEQASGMAEISEELGVSTSAANAIRRDAIQQLRREVRWRENSEGNGRA